MNNQTGQNEGETGLSRKERREERKREREEAKVSAVKSRKSKRIVRWAMTLIVLAVVVGGLGYVVAKDAKEQPDRIAGATAVAMDDWVKGNPQAEVTLIEYGDFQCPSCGAFYPIVKTLSEEFGENVQFVYRNFPLRSVHPWADLAARAAESAGLQGQFFAMHDKLFEEQTTWASSQNPQLLFEQYAGDIGLDVEQFKADIDSDAVRTAVQDDFESGLQAKVQGTPTFYLNGEKIVNPRSLDGFREILAEAVGSGAVMDEGTTDDDAMMESGDTTGQDAMDSEATTTTSE